MENVATIKMTKGVTFTIIAFKCYEIGSVFRLETSFVTIANVSSEAERCHFGTSFPDG